MPSDAMKPPSHHYGTNWSLERRLTPVLTSPLPSDDVTEHHSEIEDDEGTPNCLHECFRADFSASVSKGTLKASVFEAIANYTDISRE